MAAQGEQVARSLARLGLLAKYLSGQVACSCATGAGAAAPLWQRGTTAGLRRAGERAGAWRHGAGSGGAPSAWGPASSSSSSRGTGSFAAGGAALWRGLSSAAGGGVAAPAAAAEAAAAGGAKSLGRRARGLLRDYKQLSKAKLSALVVMTASAGFAAGSGEGPMDWAKMAWTSAGTFGAAACANALNQAYERTNDALMARTRGRPLPAGRMGRPHALAFAAAAGAAGLWVLYDKANALTAALGAANIVLYAGVYTPLKQLSVANTWVGAVVGAIPPLMGWAAAAGELEPAAGVLAAALFFWQMPHFLSLAWLCRDDYARGGFKMLSMFDPTGRRTAAAALRHCAYLLPVGFSAVALGVAGGWFAWEATALAGAMGTGAVAFYRAPSQASARKLFRGSLLYLPLLLLALAVHRRPNTHEIADLSDAAAALRAYWGDAAAPLLSLARDARAAAGAAAPEVRLRSVEERLGWVGGLRRQLEAVSPGVKCPSRVYAEDEGGAGGEEGAQEGEEEEEVSQQQQQQQQQQRGRAGGAA